MLPCLIWRLLPRGFLLCRGLVYPHGLRTTSSPRSDKADASALFCDLFFCYDVGYGSMADLAERLWATPYQRITEGSCGTPRLKACTVISSFLVCNFTTSALNLLRKSFQGSPWYWFTSKRSLETGGGAWLIMYYFLNNVENWSNEVMCPS